MTVICQSLFLIKQQEFLREGSPRFWDPPKIFGTPISPDMLVQGPRLKNPSAIPERPFYLFGKFLPNEPINVQ